MLFRSLLRYAGYGQQTASRRRPARQRPRAGLAVEALEDRTLPSTFVVDRLTDTGAGEGLAGDLRYCIGQANANPGDDTITFSVTGTINLTGALPDLSSNIDLQGPGAGSLTVRRDTGYYRIFTVASGAAVALSGLTITNGSFDYGGGISNSGTLTLNNATVSGNGASGAGGGIFNGGTLTLSNATVSGNGAGGGFDAYGGGIFNGGTLTLTNATVSGNYAEGRFFHDEYRHYFYFYGGYGGGISNSGTLTLNNATVSGNGAYGGDSGVSVGYDDYDGYGGYGGGIANGGTLTLNNATVSGNSAGASRYLSDSCGGICNAGTLTARNTLIAGNAAPTAPDLGGSLGSLGHNLIGNTSGGSGFHPTDLLNVNPLLGPLQDNGGPTLTRALLADSPALNAGDPTQLGVADQRGVVRSGGVNIGAYQASASAFVVTVSGTVASGTPFDVTVQAVDVFGQVAFGYRGTVTFSVTDPDPAVMVPADYTFSADDQGMHRFTGEFTLITRGTWTLTTADLANELTRDVMVTVDT
jgi:hypothetical protein